MIAALSLLIIITLSIIVVRIGAIALELTGLPQDVASFQAQSAFSGVGFTTEESEMIVAHPARRKIIRILILLGSAGITSSIATFILTFVSQPKGNFTTRITILIGGLILIFLFARSKYIYRIMKRIITSALKRWTTLKVYDYEHILGLSKGYTISRITVKPTSWLVNKKLKELQLESEGILILAIYRKIGREEKFIGVPTGDTEIFEGDELILYAREEAGKSLSKRIKGPLGDTEHKESVEEEKKLSQLRKLRDGYEE